MGISLPRIFHVSKFFEDHHWLKMSQKAALQYMLKKKKKKRFVIPLSYLNQPSFQGLLSQAEE